MVVVTGEAAGKRAVVETIKAEHQSLSDVLRLMRQLLSDIAAQHTEVDFGLLSAALYYIDDFACRCHHPKEERVLFAAIRRHAPELLGTLNRLQSEHQSDERFVRDLHRALVLFQGGAPEALKQLSGTFDIYAALLADHMRREETLLESVGETIPASEWRQIAEAFAAEEDPLLGPSPRREFVRLRQRIENLLPRKMRLRTGVV